MRLNRRSRSVLGFAVASSVASLLSGIHTVDAQQLPGDTVVFQSGDDGNTSTTSGLNTVSVFGSNNPSTGTGNAYVDTQYRIRTPSGAGASGSVTVAGDSFTLISINPSNVLASPTDTNGGLGGLNLGTDGVYAYLTLKGGSGGKDITTFNNLVLANGGVLLNYANNGQTVAGNIFLVPAGATSTSNSGINGDGITTTVSGGIIDTHGNNLSGITTSYTGDNYFNVASNISGGGMLRIENTGGGTSGSIFIPQVVTLGGSNTFTGGVVLDGTSTAGTTGNGPDLAIDSPTALGKGTLTIIPASWVGATPALGAPGVTLDNLTGAAETLTTNNAQTWLGNFTYVGANSLNMGSGAVTMGANVTLNVSTGSSTLSVGSVNNGSTGSYGLTKTGPGTLYLNGPILYTGQTTVSAGTLELAATGDNFSGGVSVATGTTLALAVGGTGGFSATDLANLPTSGFATGSLLGIDTTAGNLVLTSPLSGSFGLNKLGANTLTLAGGDSFGGPVTITSGTLKLGGNESFSPAGLVFVTSGPATFDLNGHSATVPGLSGGIAGSIITNSSAANSVLTVVQPAGATTFSGTTTNGATGNLAVNYTGSGNQILNGSATYSGGTRITSGTVTAGTPTSLGTGVITLNGGTLALQASGTGASSSSINGLSNSTFTVTTNGVGSNGITGSALQLTDTATGSEATSAFTNTPVPIASSFSASYQYTVTSRDAAGGGQHYAADGISFTIQTNGPSTIGGGASGFGYSGISNSAAVVTNIYAAGSSTPGTAYATEGVTPSSFASSNTDPDLDSLESATAPVTFNVTLNYNASAQTLTQTTTSTSGTYTQTFTSVNIASAVGASSAYIGFTGSDGFDWAGQTISNFSFTSVVSGPTSLANNVVAAPGTSSVIQLAVSSGSQAGAIGSLNIGSGALVTLTATSLDGVANHGSLTADGGLSISGSSGHWTGLLDLTNNTLVVHGGSLASITNQVAQGYSGGTWQGSGGITSSTAAADTSHLTAVGVIKNDNGSGLPFYGVNGTIASTFDGATPADGDILVKYTYYGDANLDGVVDGSDYSIIDNSFVTEQSTGTPISGWGNGDFNYDGVVNGSDYTLIDNAFNQQGASLAAAIATQIAPPSGGSAVPEPTTTGILGVAVLGMMGRRRRQR